MGAKAILRRELPCEGNAKVTCRGFYIAVLFSLMLRRCLLGGSAHREDQHFGDECCSA
jgi:hypothetical protein